MSGRRQTSRRARRAELLRTRAEARARGIPWGWMALALALAGVAAWGLSALARGWVNLRDEVIRSPRLFALRVVEVHPELHWLTREQVLRWTGLQAGQSLLALDLDRIQRDLQLAPQIEEAAIERVLPDTLRIYLRERRPLAQVRGVRSENGRLVPATYFLDAHGCVMPPPGADRPDWEARLAGLPVISGLPRTELRVGRKSDSPTLRAALELVRLFPYSSLAGEVELRGVDVAEPDQLLVFTAQGAEVRLALTRLEEQLHRWRLVQDAARRLGRAVRWLDLTVTNHCPLLWQPVEEAPAGPPPAVDQLDLPRAPHV